MADIPAPMPPPFPVAAASAAREGVRPVEFPDLVGVDQAVEASTSGPGGNIDLVRDIQVLVTAELGHVQMQIQDILALVPGSVIELDKGAGEPLDITVNGTLLARGEVVMVDDRFGVRITTIVDRSMRAGTTPGPRER